MIQRLALLQLELRLALRGRQGACLLFGTALLALTLAVPGFNPAFAAVLFLLVAVFSSGVLGDSDLQALRGWLTPASVGDGELAIARLLARTSLALLAYFIAVAVGRYSGIDFQTQNITFAVLVILQTVSAVALLSVLLRPPLDLFFFVALQLVALFQKLGELPASLRYALQPTSPAVDGEPLRLAVALGTAALAVFCFVVVGGRRHDG